MKIVMTGGHHTSALPVIEELKKNIPDIKIFWFGHKHSLLGDKNTTLEYREIHALGIPFYEIKAGKVYRTLNIKRLLKVPLGLFQSIYLLLKIRPAVIVSFGGYLAVPVVVAGWLLRIPSVTHEQTVVAGYANKVISRFAEKILLSWQDSQQYFPGKKTVVTGLPIRREIFKPTTDVFDLNGELPTLYITAGKTGSVKINGAVKENLTELLKITNIIHQCGDHSEYRDHDVLMEEYGKIKNDVPGKYLLRKFVMKEEIGEAYHKADMVLSRSGAHTVAELLALQKPCILVPITWASHNEQYLNASLLERSGLGVILTEENLDRDLLSAVSGMLKDLRKHTLKDPGAAESIKTDSASLITHEIIKTVKT